MEMEGSLGDDAYEQFMKHYHAAAGNFETPLLEYGIKYKDVGISPVAAQLLQTETLSIDDIARIFCIPPHLLAELSHATFSNIEQQNIFFGEFSLRPICKRIEVQLESKLFTEAERGRYSVKFDLRGLMRGDAVARANYYSSGINAGWMTPNEARRQEEMRALPGLDAPRMPMNFVQIGEDGKAVVVDNSNNNE
jgi:HK97 family phage portal protein